MAFLVLASSCKKDGDTQIYYETANDKSSILLLQIDQTTLEFEGGVELVFDFPINSADTIPLLKEYWQPSDFGYLRLYYNSLENTVFDGNMLNLGTAELFFPDTLTQPEEFAVGKNIPYPGQNAFQEANIFSYYDSIPLFDIWNSISDLEIVNGYLASDKKIAYFDYATTVDGPSTYDWYILMNK